MFRTRMSPWVVTVLCVGIALLALTPSDAQGDPKSSTAAPGGLVAMADPLLGNNLLTNGSFEQAGATAPKAANWGDNGFALDNTTAHTGQNSFRLTNANQIALAQSASQTISLKKGVYRFGGWIKMNALAGKTGGGVRFCLYAPSAWPHTVASGCTAVIKGTADWQRVQLTSIVVSQDTPAQFLIDSYSEPDGTAWFDDVEVRQEQQPLSVFMLYPNFRGMLFDDQSQTARFTVGMEPPGAQASDFILNGQVTDEGTGAVVTQSTFPSVPSQTITMDLSKLVLGHSYQVTFQMNRADGSQPYTYPAYRVVKAAGSTRNTMNVAFDEQNRFLFKGKPTFILGAYDSGMGYTGSESGWDNQLTTQRRLFDLPINFYLNYWYGAAANNSILPLMNVLQSHGIYNMTNANCSAVTTIDQSGAPWFMNGPDSVIQQRASHPGFGGFYAADECVPGLVSNVFGHYQQMKALNPTGIALGVLLPDPNIVLWRDAVDVLATDPYPMYGPEPANGYPYYQVADGARNLNNALQGSRPFAMVIQYFQFTSNSRWPTLNELRSMSFGAIAEGASGLFYWSLGQNALAYICSGKDPAHSPGGSDSWCPAKVEQYTNLKTVLTELKSLEPVLTMPDRSELLTSNSNPTIRTRIKSDGTNAYLIVYNASNTTQSADFRLGIPPKTVSLVRRGTPVAFHESNFSETLPPYEVQIFKIALSSPLPKRDSRSGPGK